MIFTQHIPPSVVMACHLTGMYDVNRNYILNDNDFSLVKEWAYSLKQQHVVGLLFHNNFSEVTISSNESKWLHFIKVDTHPDFNPNVYRYYIYHEFLKLHRQQLINVFLTDVTDVVMLNNPFIDRFFLEQPAVIFCGDEPKQLQNEWMEQHSEHFRIKISDYAVYEAEHANEVLLNCGIIGGNINMMAPFVEQLWNIHETYNSNNGTAFTGDMGAFNYLLRTTYQHAICHGVPVNTIFKSYEKDRKDCWFRHK
ncbi:MAG: hypothetical protein WD135_08535 [Ferruginibacter sp.]